MKRMTDNVDGAGKHRKRKPLRGIIRERSWAGADGEKRTAWQADFGTVNGKRLMRSFSIKADAENWLHEQRLVLEDQGHAAFGLTDAERMDAVKAREELKAVTDLPTHAVLQTVARVYVQCRRLLGESSASLADAVRFFSKHRPATGERRTVAQAVQEYVQDARENNLRPRSVKDLNYRLGKLAVNHGDRLVSEITRQDADKWLKALPLAPLSKKHFRIVAHGLFNFCIDREYYHAENPFTSKRHRRKYQADEVMPECMPRRDVQKIMAAAVEHEPSMVPGLAIGFFAGLRSNELAQLDWKDVDLDARRITVMPEVAKKRRARHVHIEENLAAWLLPYRQPSGRIAPDAGKWRSRLDTIRKKAGVEWPFNAMRHSYASNHLVKFGDAAKTALQLGHHRDTSMLFDHYRALVKAEDAASYFDIKPAEATNVIPFRQTA